MRRFVFVAWAVCAALALFSSIARADSPTTRPGQITVAVMPFDVLGDGSRAWVGKALQEGLVSDFQQRGFQAVAGSNQADYIVTGTVQLVDDQMRITGRIATSSDDKTVGRFHNDGTLRDLFSIEDSLSSKGERLMRPQATNAAPAATLAIVGPTLPSPSRYFDGNVMATLQIKDPFTAEADRYNYHPTQFYCWGYYPFYAGCYYGPFCGGWFWGSHAATISGW